MATLLKADGSTVHLPQVTFAEAQRLVGGLVEAVRLADHTILVNEDGLGLKLPLNLAATALAGQPLVGDALVLDRAEARRVLR
jgi:hypothetical protein